MKFSVPERQWVRLSIKKDEVEVRTSQVVWDIVEHSEDVRIHPNRIGMIMEDFKLGNDRILFAFFEDRFLKIIGVTLKLNKD